MNIGIIGAGFMGSMYARIAKEMPGTTLIGVTAKGSDRARKLAQELGVREYGDYRELIRDTAIDVVSVCTPTDTPRKSPARRLTPGSTRSWSFPYAATSANCARSGTRAFERRGFARPPISRAIRASTRVFSTSRAQAPSERYRTLLFREEALPCLKATTS